MKKFKKATFYGRHRKRIVTAIQGCNKVLSMALNVYPRFIQFIQFLNY